MFNLLDSKAGTAVRAFWRGNRAALTPAQLSQTISFARITLIIGLVFLHYQSFPHSGVSPFHGLDIRQHQVATFINSFVLFFFFSVVPLLSMVSGWLYFSFPAEATLFDIGRRIRRRFVSLYVPLIVWNAFFLVLMLLLFSQDPENALLDRLNIHLQTAGLRQYINAIFAITQHPIGFQFWFVRDLFVTILISPLLWLVLRRAPFIGLAFLACVWIGGFNLFIFFRTDVLFFFYLGGLLRLRHVPLEIGRRATLILLSLYVAMVALRTLAPYVVGYHEPMILEIATRGMRPFGVLAAWGLFLWLAPTRFGTVVARFGGLAFFLHAAHFPLLAEIKILLWERVPAETDSWMLIHYAASVVITVGVGIAAGLALSTWAPRVFALMNGGRALIGSRKQLARDSHPTGVRPVPEGQPS